MNNLTNQDENSTPSKRTTLREGLGRATDIPRLLWIAYIQILKNHPLLWVLGTVGILSQLPLRSWFEMGVKLMSQLRGILGV